MLGVIPTNIVVAMLRFTHRIAFMGIIRRRQIIASHPNSSLTF
jgi:hypothetical protein